MAFFNLANLEIDQVFLVTSVDNAGLLVSAAEHLERAIEHFSRVARQTPEDLEVRQRVVLSFRMLGEIRIKQQDFIRAEESYVMALMWMRELAAENPRVRQYQEELVRLLLMSGQRSFVQQDWEGAEAPFRESIQRLTAIVDDNEATPEVISDLVQALYNLAAVHVEREEWSEALHLARQALPHAQQLTVDFPAEGKYAEQLRDVQRIIEHAEARTDDSTTQ
jgi:tetratricopeptide (TPR) repeat protein